MKTERNILMAFLLNLLFSVFEIVGGAFTGSVAIVSDAVHDLGDAFSIGISYFLEKKSKRKPDEIYTYGYARYSVIGGLITTIVLLIGSVVVIYNAISKIISPTPIDYNGMIVFAVFGVAVNFVAAFLTHGEGSFNQRAVNLHMLEDVFGWVVVLIGAVVMRFTDFSLIDPIMSIGVAVLILIGAFKNLLSVIDLFLEKSPCNIRVQEIKEHIEELDGVNDVHHIHVWSIDGNNALATMHVVSDADPIITKAAIRSELSEHGINHVTIEIESSDECCSEENCDLDVELHSVHSHHSHNHLH